MMVRWIRTYFIHLTIASCVIDDREDNTVPLVPRPYVDLEEDYRFREGMIDYLERVAAIVHHNHLFTQIFLDTHEDLVGEVIERTSWPDVFGSAAVFLGDAGS